MQPFVKQTINKKSVFKTLGLALLAATLGFGFQLKDVPLTFGVDYRPMVAFNFGDGDAIIDKGFRNIGVTLTYHF